MKNPSKSEMENLFRHSYGRRRGVWNVCGSQLILSDLKFSLDNNFKEKLIQGRKFSYNI